MPDLPDREKGRACAHSEITIFALPFCQMHAYMGLTTGGVLRALPIRDPGYRVRAKKTGANVPADSKRTPMFVTPAYAQAAGGGAAAFTSFVPLILIFGIMYFLLIRPQQKKAKEHRSMVEALRRGDQVLTKGGIVGKVQKVHEDGTLDVEIAEGVKVKVLRATIVQVMSKTEPAAA